MRKQTLASLLILSVAPLAPLPSRAQGFCAAIEALTQDSSVAAAHWGVAVTTLDGATLCGLHDAKLFRPASNNKIFTTAAALALLGATHASTTTVHGVLDPATGIVTGDLVLLGAGDANLDSNDLPYRAPAERPKAPPPFTFRDLDDLASQLAAKGVKSIAGDVVGDDTFFPWEPYPVSWSTDDLVWGYGAPVSALTLADNQLPLTITPGTVLNPAAPLPPSTVTLDQHGVPYYTVESNVQTVPAKSHDGIIVERLPGSRTLRVFGTRAADAPPDVEQIAIDDPAAYATQAFRTVLARHGIEVAGSTRSRHRPLTDGTGLLTTLTAPTAPRTQTSPSAPASCPEPVTSPILAAHHSAPLADDVILTNKVSQNLHAELLFHLLGHSTPCSSGSIADSASAVRAFLLRAGVLPADIVLFDGSGLSTHDLVTPRAVARFLSFAATQPWFPQWRASLPVGGVDGGLVTRFAGPLKARVFAKTGTLGESRALSGYLTAASGKTLVFSVLVDNDLPTNTADRTTMDKIVELIAAQN